LFSNILHHRLPLLPVLGHHVGRHHLELGAPAPEEAEDRERERGEHEDGQDLGVELQDLGDQLEELREEGRVQALLGGRLRREHDQEGQQGEAQDGAEGAGGEGGAHRRDHRGGEQLLGQPRHGDPVEGALQLRAQRRDGAGGGERDLRS